MRLPSLVDGRTCHHFSILPRCCPLFAVRLLTMDVDLVNEQFREVELINGKIYQLQQTHVEMKKQ